MSELAYVKLSEIQLWTDNPRTRYLENKEEIINLVKNQKTAKGNKLIELTKSLVKDGMYEPIGILRFDDKFMIVKEGNRRIACLKLLNDPKILPNEYSMLQTFFKELRKTASKDLFNKIPARIFNQDENEELETWIELRHNGLQEGKGLAVWGAVEKENWKKYRGKNTPLLDFQNYLIEKKILTTGQVNAVNKTNWERILGTKGRAFLGIKFENGEYVINNNDDQFRNKIRVVIENLKGKSVAVVYDNDSIEEFLSNLNYDINFQEIRKNSNKELISKNIEMNKTKGFSIETDETVSEKLSSSQPEKLSLKNNVNKTKKYRRSSKPGKFMDNIICDLKSSQETDGIIRLSQELKNMSKNEDYKKYPIASAMLMRSLLEQCLIYYLKRRNKWNKFAKSRKNGPTLSEIIDRYKTDDDIFKQDKQLERMFNVLVKNIGIKDYLDLIVHHPHKIGAKPDCLDIIATTGYLALIQYIIDY